MRVQTIYGINWAYLALLNNTNLSALILAKIVKVVKLLYKTP
jgi:hypothetical protein